MKLKERGIIVPDQHFPLQDDAAINCVVKAIKKVKPDVFVNLGDVGEWESVSAWRYKDKKLPPLEYQIPIIDEDVRLVNEGLDIWDDALEQVGCKRNIYYKVITICGWIILLLSIPICIITVLKKHVK